LIEADELIDQNKTFKDIQHYLDKEHSRILANKTQKFEVSDDQDKRFIK
jgi:hypothetical protein